jgi:hypothetical protein
LETQKDREIIQSEGNVLQGWDDGSDSVSFLTSNVEPYGSIIRESICLKTFLLVVKIPVVWESAGILASLHLTFHTVSWSYNKCWLAGHTAGIPVLADHLQHIPEVQYQSHELKYNHVTGIITDLETTAALGLQCVSTLDTGILCKIQMLQKSQLNIFRKMTTLLFNISIFFTTYP